MGTFELLHPKVQEFIYRQNWTNFRPIQDRAIEIVKKEVSNILICAPTASGKTEAAFLPIVSSIVENYSESYKAIYISPLKALINDQFRRIDYLCKEIGIPVTKWHGDVSQSHKSKSLKDPMGILLITPESLEAMLINKPELVAAAFKKLEFVVIDEIHSFVGTERGAQLRSLLKRIEYQAACSPRRLALSATVGNPNEVAQWMSESRKTEIVEDPSWDDSGGVEGLIRGFTNKVLSLEEIEAGDSELNPKFSELICVRFSSGKNLIFGNSKRHLEETIYAVNKVSQELGGGGNFLIHHGSLSKETKELAETELKESQQAVSVFCTSTLEMGIDIGSIEKVGIIDPPWSVSGFAQRVGRSGRKAGVPKKFEFFISQQELKDDTIIAELLREDLVKSIAIVQLYLRGFKEPLDIGSPHFSTLVHQIIALSRQRSGVSRRILDKFIGAGPFGGQISQTELDELLNNLESKGILARVEGGDYLPGRIGEKLVENYEFYSVFQSSEQWSVIFNDSMIGQIPVIGVYSEGSKILLGGKVWMILEVVEKSRRLVVKPSVSATAPVFVASFGQTHSHIHEQMKQIYSSVEEYKFLDREALQLLSEGRKNFSLYVKNQKIYEMFTGSKIQNTLTNILDLLKIEHGISEVALDIRVSKEIWVPQVKSYLERLTSNDLAAEIPRENKIVEKFDSLLTSSLLDRSYSEKFLDIGGLVGWLAKIK